MPLFVRHDADFTKHAFAGIVDENIEAGEFPVDRREERRHIAGLCNIRRMPEDSSQRLHSVYCAIHGFAGASADCHGYALAQQTFGDSAADAAGSTCNSGKLAREAFHIRIVRGVEI